MRAYIVLAVIIGSGFASPIETIDNIEELQRTKKSSYGAPAPCAGAVPYAPVSQYLGPIQPAYREDELIEGEHTELKARAYYDLPLASLSASSGAYGSGLSTSLDLSGAGGNGYAAAPSAGGYSGSGPHLSTSVSLAGLGGGSYSGAASSAGGYSAGSAGGYGASGLAGPASGPAVGLFPHAQLGGCNVPLLLSCAPNVVSGHLAATQAAPHPYSAPAYRSFEEDTKKEVDWAKARKASHHKVSEDFAEPHPGNHHVVSQDYPEPNLTRIVPVHAPNEHTEKKD